MRMAHLYPERKALSVFPTHHEIHLREEEAMALTKELQRLNIPGLWSAAETEFPLLAKIHRLLSARNSDYDEKAATIPAKTTYSYPSGLSTTLQEVSGANKEIAKGEKVRWEGINWTGHQSGRFRAPQEVVRPYNPEGSR